MGIAFVHTTLENAVAAITGLPTLQRENTRNTTQSLSWTRFTLLPIETVGATIGDGGKDRLAGLAQVDLFTAADSGMSSALTKAELVLAAFPRGTELGSTQTVHIDHAWIEAGTQEGKHYHTPVMIRWHSLVPV
jgi:hypothetical protein